MWIVSISLFCLASLLGALNFIATTIDLRAPGMSLMRMPLTVWGWLVTAILGLLAFGVLLAAGILLLLDRSAGTSFFIPADLVVNDQLQNCTAAARRCCGSTCSGFLAIRKFTSRFFPAWEWHRTCSPLFRASRFLVIARWLSAICAIGFLGFMVWGHHMFVSGMSPYSGFAFSVLTMTIGVPSAIKTFNWLGTLWGGKDSIQECQCSSRSALCRCSCPADLSGLFLAQPAVDIMLHATYFVVAHFHLVMGVAAIFGIFAATYFWFPKMFGRMMNEPLGKIHFWFTFVGVYCIFMPMHFLGFAGASAALCRRIGRRLPRAAAAGPSVHDHCRVHHRRRAARFPVQLFLQLEIR